MCNDIPLALADDTAPRQDADAGDVTLWEISSYTLCC